MKFKVGDRVRIKQVYFYSSGKRGEINKSLSKLIGMTGKIISVLNNGITKRTYELQFDNGEKNNIFAWTDDELELIQPKIDDQGNLV